MQRQRGVLNRFFLILISAVLLAGCGREPTPVPKPTLTLGPTDSPRPVPTETPLPSPAPTDTPLLTDTEAPTATSEPTPMATPTATPEPTSLPKGYYDSPEDGWAIRFPTDWEVEETGEPFPALFASDPDFEIVFMLGWDYATIDGSVEEVAGVVAEALAGEIEMEVAHTESEWITLADGTEALRYAVTDAESPPYRMELVVAERGARQYILIILSEATVFEARERTIATVIDSLILTPLRLHDVDRNTALVLAGSEPYDMDPATTELNAAGYMGNVFSGLVGLNTELQVVPDLAESWQISEDGRTYTFYLRPGAVFHDGKPVTASDFKYSWERAADPEIGSAKTRTYLGDIVGVQAKLDGEADEIAGVVVVDEHTLQVTIDEPKVYFLAKLTWPAAFVVDQENVEAGEPDDWWHEPNGTGPFTLEKWEDDVLVFARNDAYYGPAPRLEHLVYLLDAGPSIRLYESGEIDMTGVGGDLVERVEDPADPLHDELHTVPDLCTTYVVLDASQPPFDDPLIRQAFSYAVDQAKIVDVVLQGTVAGARGPLPPGMPGHSPDIESYYFDGERALELIAQSSYGDPSNLPAITYTDSGYTELDPVSTALIETWEEVFGIEIEIELLEPFGYVSEVKDHHGQMFGLGWCADYPDPQNFLDILYHTESEENLGRYSNPEVDALLERARVERDPEARLALYQQIEQMLVDDAASIWLIHNINRVLIKPYVHGYEVLPMDVSQVLDIYLDPR